MNRAGATRRGVAGCRGYRVQGDGGAVRDRLTVVGHGHVEKNVADKGLAGDVHEIRPHQQIRRHCLHLLTRWIDDRSCHRLGEEHGRCNETEKTNATRLHDVHLYCSSMTLACPTITRGVSRWTGTAIGPFALLDVMRNAKR